MQYWVSVTQWVHFELLEYPVASLDEAVRDFIDDVEAGNYHCPGESGTIEAIIEIWKDEECEVLADWDAVEATYEGTRK